MVKVNIVSGKGDKVKTTPIDLPESATVQELKKEFVKATKKDIHRVSFKIDDAEGKAVKLDKDSKALKDYNIKDGQSITFKDLGPQIGYRTVFVLEYLGPIIFVALYALRPAFLYGAEAAATPYNWVAKLGIICWILHFAKREFETFFIHKFSHPTMPLSNLFKNCVYYWSFGAVIGYPLCNPTYTPPAETVVHVGLAIFVLSELGNLICHIMLSNMRPKEGSQDRNIPRGFLFEYVACPNYTFEVLSWVGFSVFTQIPFAYLFTLIGFLQMADWAQKKHKGYKKQFDADYIKLRRKAILPFLY